jgi:hypothetical protein
MGMGDVKIAEARSYETGHQRILRACTKAFQNAANRANCSGFVKAVAAELRVPIGNLGAGQANDIYDEIGKPPWISLGKGHTGAVKAAYCARQGNFVIAAWKDPSGGNGHVVVVTDLDLRGLGFAGKVSDRSVLASWGVFNQADLARDGGPIRTTFNVQLKLPDVIYAWYPGL